MSATMSRTCSTTVVVAACSPLCRGGVLTMVLFDSATFTMRTGPAPLPRASTALETCSRHAWTISNRPAGEKKPQWWASDWVRMRVGEREREMERGRNGEKGMGTEVTRGRRRCATSASSSLGHNNIHRTFLDDRVNVGEERLPRRRRPRHVGRLNTALEKASNLLGISVEHLLGLLHGVLVMYLAGKRKKRGVGGALSTLSTARSPP